MVRALSSVQESPPSAPNSPPMSTLNPGLTTETLEFEGWPGCLRVSNGDAEIIVSTQIGPRLLRYGRTGGPNAFHIIPETHGQSGGDEWTPYGGHRLWHAPETKPRTYHPDNAPYGEPVVSGDMLRLVSLPESTTGIAKEMHVRFAPSGPAVRVEHRLTNHNLWPVTLSAWALSIVALGGRVVLPQEPFASHDDELAPARPVVVWPFTDMADPRWRWGTKYITLHQTGAAGNPQKVGVYNAQGWAAHVTDAQVFLVFLRPAPGGPAVLPDMGSNFEAYTDGPFQELETLGPLTMLEPGASLSHTEDWFLAPVASLADTDAALDAGLLPLVGEARAQTARVFGG